MNSSLTTKYKGILEAISFAHRLFNRADKRYLRFQNIVAIIDMCRMFVFPIVIAGSIQQFVNKAFADKAIPFSYLITAAAMLIVGFSLIQYFKSIVSEFKQLFQEKVQYYMRKKTDRKLARLRYAVLMDAKAVNTMNNNTLNFYQLESLATKRLGFVTMIITMVAGAGLSIYINPYIILACFCITFTNDRIRSHFWKKAEDCQDQLVEEKRKADNYRAHTTSVLNFIQYALWGYVPYMTRNLTLINRTVIRAHREIYFAERRARTLWTPVVLTVSFSIVLWAIKDVAGKPQAILAFGIWFTAFRTVMASMSEGFRFWRSARGESREFERFKALMALPERDLNLPRLEASTSYTIELHNLTYTYPGRTEPALNNIVLSFAQGEQVALVGMNGSGKTTLLHLLCGVLDPQQGSVKVNGVDLQKVDIASWHEVMACVTQMSDIGMTVGELITGNKLTEKSGKLAWSALETVGLNAEVRKLKLGLDTRVGEAWSDGTDFSTGQRQKLRLAVVVYKVLMKKTRIIILDEPTANLDVESKVAVIKAFARLGITLIVSVHDQSLLSYFTRVVKLEKGKLVSDERQSH